jgi:tRNA pseudouridine38-40 synthase
MVAAVAQLTPAASDRVALHVAGRTDAGVHAVGQVANLHLHASIAPERVAPALNAHLPATIRVHRSEAVAAEFHARRDSVAKRYRYRIYEGPCLAPLERQRAWHWRKPLDMDAMGSAATHLTGELDFEAFRSTHCDASHARRHMLGICITREPRPPCGSHLDIIFHANAFCRHMCRILAGTLAHVGAGRLTPDDVRAALHSRDRRRAGPTAPAGGLTLLQVEY